MDFSLSQDQQMLVDLCEKIAQGFEDSYWQKIDEEYGFPREFWSTLVEQGILGITIPEEYGGSGLGMVEMCLAAEALSSNGGDCGGMFVGGPVFGGCLINSAGTPEQKAQYLPAIVKGELWAGGFTEPNSGSNITTIRTEARKEDGHYLVKGQKMYISNIKVASHIGIMCRTSPYDPARRTEGVSLLVGDLPGEGLEARPLKKMGSHFMDTNAVFFDDFKVPEKNLVGEEGKGWKALYAVLNPERLAIAASCIGTGNYLIRKAVQYASERSIWGKPLATHQGLQFPLAEARIQLECARLKVYEAAWLYDQGRECGVQATSAKYAAAHASLYAADRAIQTLGGAGYISESGIERHYRNLRLNRIAPVTDEMTLNYIAQHDLGMPRSY
ncbi:acyl-CoA dehydrogenase family protein [Immundisolibacter sp.]|uniref:acyl-CoA dehydrogenase family protein n=1 Tax=Immundisolibacter sp. TaxID=1934948 RepID=UPI002B18C825|nr:acyl-CoA dehydrogenase family protein [Immundisolibacter sp.]MEA3220887.1 Acyl-CoA dehydrogenase fadE12 [Immundisolibacter sp.]